MFFWVSGTFYLLPGMTVEVIADESSVIAAAFLSAGFWFIAQSGFVFGSDKLVPG